MLLVCWCALAASGGHVGGLLPCHCQAGGSVATWCWQPVAVSWQHVALLWSSWQPVAVSWQHVALLWSSWQPVASCGGHAGELLQLMEVTLVTCCSAVSLLMTWHFVAVY